MENQPNQITDTEAQSVRRKVLWWGGLGSIALLFTSFRFRNLFSPRKEVISCAPEQTKTIKMLTQDGKLVEIDAALISRISKEKISDEDLKKFVNPRHS